MFTIAVSQHQLSLSVAGSKQITLHSSSQHYVDTQDNLLAYSISLIENVLKLHTKANIMHCDIKLQNVQWNGESKSVVLLDFGYAQRIEEVCPVLGTSGFEAPEVVQGQENTPKTDAFSEGRFPA